MDVTLGASPHPRVAPETELIQMSVLTGRRTVPIAANRRTFSMTILALYQNVRVSGRRTLKKRDTRIGLIRTILEDLDVAVARDPSTRSRVSALRHPGVLAMWGHRIAHRLYVRGLRRMSLRVAALARFASHGIIIHPGASLGRRVLLDRAGAIDVCET